MHRAQRELRLRGPAKSSAARSASRIRMCHLEECDRGELRRQRFDTIVCVNVLEHIEDDVQALTLFREVVAPAPAARC